jgi:DNA repair protein RecN (Recombination protein N)
VIRYIRVEDFAVIDRVEAEFGTGLTVLTGSTGAGKSLLVGAIGLVLGARAGALDLRAGADRAVVEAVFESTPTADEWLDSLSLPPAEDGLVVRRVVGRGARSQINGETVPLRQLGELGSLLVDLHGQHSHQALLRPGTHLVFLDSFGGLDGQKTAFGEAFSSHKKLKSRRDAFAVQVESARRELAMSEALLGEIEAVSPEGNELETLRSRRALAANAERLLTTASSAVGRLTGDEGAICDVLASVERELTDAAKLDPWLTGRVEALRDASYKLQELGAELASYVEDAETDPVELQRIEDRIAEITALTRKHGTDEAGLADVASRLRDVVERASTGDADLKKLDAELASARVETSNRASALHSARVAAAERLSRAVRDELRSLGMESSRFGVSVSLREDERSELSVDGVDCRAEGDGVDDVEFLLASAPAEPLRPLSRVASGGEASRVMLAIKSALAEIDPSPTLIFDEIDAGLGGEVADLVGVSLSRLSRKHQVLVITHLHQIASRADRHVRIRREEKKGRAEVTVEQLHGDERVDELARMLSGGGVEEEARAHAEALLDARGRREDASG